MRIVFSILVASLMVAVAGPVFAQGAGSAVLRADGPALTIPQSGGTLLRLSRPAATVFVADPAVADVQVKSPRLIYLFGRKPGSTTFFAVDARDEVIDSRPVHVAHDVERINQAVRTISGDAPVRVQSAGTGVVIEGEVGSSAQARDINALARSLVAENEPVIDRVGVTRPMQVNLRVRVAEMSREVTKRFGLNGDLIAEAGGSLAGLATGQAPGAGTALNLRTGGAANIFASLALGPIDLNAVFDALESNQLLTTLAEPNLTARSGETASFLAGGEFPILVPQGDGTLSISFKKFGVSLSFTPTVLEDGRINLHVRPEVSQLSATGAIELDGFTIPALTTRRTETTVDLASGQSLAIAGLLQSDVSEDVNKFPGLGNLPVLGALFRSDSFRRLESELVIVVTPYLVRPVGPARVAVPTEGYEAPSDRERLIGRDSGRDLAGGPARNARALIGPAGFTIE
jgi:pilus assembly protein CpaC